MRSLTIISSLAALILVGICPIAKAASLSGTWRGSGFVNPKSGNREKVRCRITYKRQSNKVFRVSAVCASTSGKIRQTGEVLMVTTKRYVGDFYNSDFDISGRVRVVLRGSRQTVSFSSKTGNGRITLRKR